MLRSTGPRGDIKGAIRAVLGVDDETLTRDWHADTRRTYAPFFETTRQADTFGKPLMTRQTSGGDINLAPSISPDGKRMVFLSERSLFSIDMYLAEVATGRIVRQLTETAGDPHFDSLQFLGSAGDWAPDNRRFVFAALSKGQPVLTVIDVDTGRRELEHEFPDIGEILNPAWSPDGRLIAFSALKGGVLDLFLFDLEDRMLTRLTDDPFADLDPEWSPDGRQLAWVTDRFSSNIDVLVFGNYRIGVMEVASRQVRALAGFSEGRNTNPEFAADGRSLFFIAAPDGVPNVYRADLASGATSQITNVLSGVSGITPLTPALSVSAAAPGLVFTVFESDDYNIYRTDSPQPLAGRTATAVDRSAAVLPPSNRREGDVAQLLQSPTVGLPPRVDYQVREYQPRLSLDAVGQPTVGIGADRFGAFGAGGLSFMWSDMLGNHQLGTTIQVTNRFEEIGGAVGYINRTHRWNWGLVGEQTPYVTGFFAQGLTTVDGNTVFVEETHRVTQINRAVSGLFQYPFSRAHRFELAGGVRRISFDRDIESLFFSPTTGQFLGDQQEELPRPDSLNLGETSAALVYDSSVFGATSPIIGQRYRFEFSQAAGSLLYSGFLTDYRKYFMPVRPLTIAVRGLHYGRYGRDGEDDRLSPLFVGYPGLVRGYEVGSWESGECQVTVSSQCEAFDRLVGSRMAIVGAEFRVPLLGLFNPRAMYGPLPVEIGVFSDAGVAWTSDAEPAFLGGDRDWVRSVGAVLRFNAFGFAVGELDYVRPLDRPGRGWMWQFNLTPGF
jgi:hypothetical protein